MDENLEESKYFRYYRNNVSKQTLYFSTLGRFKIFKESFFTKIPTVGLACSPVKNNSTSNYFWKNCVLQTTSNIINLLDNDAQERITPPIEKYNCISRFYKVPADFLYQTFCKLKLETNIKCKTDGHTLWMLLLYVLNWNYQDTAHNAAQVVL